MHLPPRTFNSIPPLKRASFVAGTWGNKCWESRVKEQINPQKERFAENATFRKEQAPAPFRLVEPLLFKAKNSTHSTFSSSSMYLFPIPTVDRRDPFHGRQGIRILSCSGPVHTGCGAPRNTHTQIMQHHSQWECSHSLQSISKGLCRNFRKKTNKSVHAFCVNVAFLHTLFVEKGNGHTRM